MALTARYIKNQGDAIVDQEGTPLEGIEIKWILVDANGTPIDTWDVITGERVVSKESISTTDVNGEFTIGLWPNSRGADTTQYLCIPGLAGTRPFMFTLEEGDLSDLKWIDAYANGVPLEPGEINRVYNHINTVTIHRAIYFGTSDTPPDPAGLDDGTIYIQYTA